MGFPRREYWSGLPFPILPDPGIEPSSPKSGYHLYLLLIPLFVNSRGKKKNLGDLDTKPVAFPTYNFIILFLAVLGLPCCLPAFSSCGEWGLLSSIHRHG